ncbi:MAG: hypothetical protein WEA31_09235, partial [Pirellulales bacterium]
MAKIRRIIRRIKQDHPAAFDEQLWPVNLAIFVLAAFCSGLLLATSNFDDAPFIRNGWTYLSATWLIAIGTMVFTAKFGGRHARRMQLSAVLSLILVLIFGITAGVVDVFYSPQIADAANERRPDVQQTKTKDVFPDMDKQEIQELAHQQAVDVKPPEEDTEDLQKADTPEEQEVEKTEETEPVEEVETEVEPNQIERTETAKTTPRAAESTSALSKQTQPTDAPRPNKAAAPELTSAEEPKPKSNQLEAAADSLQRQQSETSIQRASTEPTPRTESEQSEVKMARQATPQAAQPRPAAAQTTLTKAVDQPRQTPTVAKVTPPDVAKSSNTDPTELKPSVAVERVAAASPTVNKQQTETQPAASVDVAQPTEARQQPSPAAPVLAQAPQPTPSRSPQALDTPTDSKAVASQVATAPAEQPAAETSLNPATEAVSRAEASAAAEAPSRPESSAVASEAVTNATADTRPRQSTDASQPSVNPTAAAADVAKRSATVAPATASPVAADSPAVAASSQPSPNASEPQPLAVSKSIRGTSGAGQAANFDRGLPNRQTDSFVANASARRAESTAQTPAAAGLSLSSPATIAKDRAMADAPSAIAQAEALETFSETGARQTADVDATASAATKQSVAQAAVGPVTAEAGKAEIDTGPTQKMANRSTGVGSGGGQPQISHSSTTAPVSRTAAGGAETASIDVTAQAPTAVDVAAAIGGGRPQAPEADSQSTAATRQATAAGSQPSVDRVETGEPSDGPSGGGAPNVARMEAARSSTTEALPGAVAGGGTDQPAKATGVNFTATAQANAPIMESVPGGVGDPEALNQLADAAEAIARDEGREGVSGPAIDAPTGAAADEVAMNVPNSTAIGEFAGERSATESGAPGPQVAQDSGGAPLKETGAANIPGVARVDFDPLEFGGGGAEGAEATEEIALGAGTVEVEQRESGGVQVLAKAEHGAGGLGMIAADDVGNVSRKAQRDSKTVNVSTDARFQARDVGGPIATNVKARAGEGAFEDRKKGESGDGASGLTPLALEQTIISGLEFLRKHQSGDGSWSFNNFGGGRPGYETETARIQSDAAATGLALLSFLGAGYDHFDGRDQYPDVVKRGLDFLIANQQEDGCLYIDQDPYSSRSARFYSHAIAATALCEAYGMTGDKKLRDPAQKAIDYIVKTQHPDRGGWRYAPEVSSDTSVTGWMFTAVKSGDLAGLDVPDRVYRDVSKWLDLAQITRGDGSRYVYNPFAPATSEQAHGREATPAMTALGLLLRLYEGWDRDKTDVVRGAEYVVAHLPSDAREQPDTYYWYYASQIMYHMKGDYWDRWEKALYPQLRRTQVQTGPMAGSWSPGRDKWGEYGG